MFHNRYGAGLLFWKTGAKAQVSWTFCRPHEDVFNDFDGARVNHREPKEQATVYPHFLKPDDWSTYQGAIPTIAWEALREGVDDYRYLHTLAQTIAEARAHRDERVRAAAREAQEMLDALVNAVPWANPLGKVAFETRRMQQVRRAAADQIIRLRTALTGKPVAKRRQDLSQVTLVVRATEGVTAQAAPAIAVLPTTVPPVIDGDLSDPCWTESAVATNFYRANDGGKPEVDTEARILYDARALYVSFRCPEPAMAKLRAARRGHDTPEVWLDDGIEFFVAGGPRAPYAHLIVNTNGAVYDERNQDPSWNSSAEVRVRKEANAYCVEIALPWSDLEKAGIRRSPVMAVNFCRSRFAGPEKDRLSAWSCTYGGFHVPDRFGWALVQEEPGAAIADAPAVLGQAIGRGRPAEPRGSARRGAPRPGESGAEPPTGTWGFRHSAVPPHSAPARLIRVAPRLEHIRTPCERDHAPDHRSGAGDPPARRGPGIGRRNAGATGRRSPRRR